MLSSSFLYELRGRRTDEPCGGSFCLRQSGACLLVRRHCRRTAPPSFGSATLHGVQISATLQCRLALKLLHIRGPGTLDILQHHPDLIVAQHIAKPRHAADVPLRSDALPAFLRDLE